MKKLSFLLFLCICSSAALGQSFYGKGDQKFQVGANFQEYGTGITATYDKGVGPNLSFGIMGTYLLDVDEYTDADFADRFDAKVRFSAHLQNVLNICDCFDIYPGLNLGLRNFGGHAGVRYFFNDGIGVFAETVFPISRYNTDDYLPPAKLMNNDLSFVVGLSFNL